MAYNPDYDGPVYSAGWFPPHEEMPEAITAPHDNTRAIELEVSMQGLRALDDIFFALSAKAGHARENYADYKASELGALSNALQRVVALRVKLARRAAKLAAQRDLRVDFLHDRAHAVVRDTLLHLDKKFWDVGFGGWMPFRFPDQWLMFVGVLRRVLAANGLIHSPHAQVYRKLLEDTPYPHDESREQVPPEIWSTVHSYQVPRTMDELIETVAHKENARRDAEAK